MWYARYLRTLAAKEIGDAKAVFLGGKTMCRVGLGLGKFFRDNMFTSIVLYITALRPE